MCVGLPQIGEGYLQLLLHLLEHLLLPREAREGVDPIILSNIPLLMRVDLGEDLLKQLVSQVEANEHLLGLNPMREHLVGHARTTCRDFCGVHKNVYIKNCPRCSCRYD